MFLAQRPELANEILIKIHIFSHSDGCRTDALTEVFCGIRADLKEICFSLGSRLSLAWTTEGPWSHASVPPGDARSWAASAEANEEPFTFVWRVRSRQKRLSANKDKQISHLNLNTWLLPSGSCMCPGVDSRIHHPLTPGRENVHPQVTS